MTQTTTRPDPAARSAGDGERLSRKSAYDYVIVGAGPNGLGAAAYLSKWGFSVCVLEARPEAGGGAENAEPIPGYSIDPHATLFYAAASPALEQLELGRFGLRLSPNTGGLAISSNGASTGTGTNIYHDDVVMDPELMAGALDMEFDSAKFYLEFMANLKPRIVEFLRSIYWTPPYDHRWGVQRDDLPETKIFKDIVPTWDPEYLDMSYYEFLEGIGLPDPMMCGSLINAWGNGPHPFWKQMLIPAFAVGQLLLYSNATPVGGMHAFAHSLARCALAHGAKMFVNAPVTEIIVEEGRAVGVRVDDESTLEEKTISANLGVIFNNHVKNLPKIATSGAFTPDFIQRVDDLNLRGGSLFVANFVINELPRFTVAPELNQEDADLTSIVLNSDTPMLMEMMRDVYSLRTHPSELDHYAGVWYLCHGAHDRTRLRAKDGYVLAMNLQVPVPEEHRDGPEAVNLAKDEIVDNCKALLRKYAPNMTDDKFIDIFVNTPHDTSMRNMAFVGGNWMGMRESVDEWGQNKPLPELARYRTPVDGLYLCHQTSHPGGLCLVAVPYNLMHMLHEDYEEVSSTTPDWWFPSPFHITDEEAGTK